VKLPNEGQDRGGDHQVSLAEARARKLLEQMTDL